MIPTGQDGEGLVTEKMVERAVSNMYVQIRARGGSYTFYQLATYALDAVVPDIHAALSAVAPDIAAQARRECAVAATDHLDRLLAVWRDTTVGPSVVGAVDAAFRREIASWSGSGRTPAGEGERK